MKYKSLTPLNNRIFLPIFISALFLLLFAPKTTFGATVLSNYPPTNHGNFTAFDTSRIKAVIFDIPAGNNYALNSFTASLGGDITSTYQADLYTASGITRDTFVATLGTVNVNTGSQFIYTDITFTPSIPITLLASQRYWLQLTTPMAGNITQWSASDPAVTPSGVFSYVGYRISVDSGGSWGSSNALNNFVLDADIITPTATPTDTPTDTPVPPTNTPTDTPTDTPVPPTNTPTDTATGTPVPPTNTPTDTPTNTPIPPTDTPTSTPLPPTSTPTSTPVSPTPTPTLPICIFGLPPGGVQGRVLVNVLAFYNPSLEATTNILVQGGSSWWIIDARNGFYKLWISCEGEPIWVLANTVAPNFDHVWNGAELPDAGE